MSELRAVRKYAAQHDLFNRLHSIAADEAFVRTVAQEWYEGRFDVVANQRCGNWYCDPSTSSKVYAYFKSTDGHMFHWDFNLRRSNLSLASHAEERGGLILVDSTRRGKRMPDGLSKTVPICASRWVNNGADAIPSVTKVARRTVGFEYVPGGGDDDELWARGLTPILFHANREVLLSTERDDLPHVVDDIVSRPPPSSMDSVLPSDAVGVPSHTSRLALEVGSPITSTSSWVHASSSHLTIRVVEVDKHPRNIPHLLPLEKEMILAVPSAKSDGKAYAAALVELVEYVRDEMGDSAVVLLPAHPSAHTKAIRAYTTLDKTADDSDPPPPPPSIEPSPVFTLVDSRKLIIPLALVLLCSVPELTPELHLPESITKAVIASQMHTLVALWPDGNPPRAALKRVNEFLMSEGRRA
ncbi:hypothetical protein IAR55_001909 [Kwoniella newhampshirensis]|uniref:tRNA '-O-ribosylphosphate transferase n=1 Tax=Kwoniella newhampshirensis TaxID=1651941 RepID=A0AAW0Z3R9_9TREE